MARLRNARAKGKRLGRPRVVGTGAGKGAAFITGKKEVSLPPETRLTFTHAEPLSINAEGRPERTFGVTSLSTFFAPLQELPDGVFRY